MKPRLKVGDTVWKSGTGYAGPGVIMAEFKGWMGNIHFVVAHAIAGGNGYFYHIYTALQLDRDTSGKPGEIIPEPVEKP